VRRPIIIVGAARSGTSVLGDLVDTHPDVAYWMEPNPVWRHGNAYRPDDVLGTEHLTPRIADYIDRKFFAFMTERGAARFAEKTPANSLRLPFVHALYPDSRIIHIIRDGRAVVPSTLRRERLPPRGTGLRRRLSEVPPLDWPSYAPVFFRTIFRTVFRKKQATYWGPRPPEWKAWIGLEPEIRAARQWKACVGAALEFGRGLPRESYLELRFEDLMADPGRVLHGVLEFAELRPLPEVVERASEGVRHDRNPSWQRVVSPEVEARIVAEMNPLLADLGYG